MHFCRVYSRKLAACSAGASVFPRLPVRFRARPSLARGLLLACWLVIGLSAGAQTTAANRAAGQPDVQPADTAELNRLIKDLSYGGPFRAYAAEKLGQLGDARAVEPLVYALGDAAEPVRASAAGALEKLWLRLPRSEGAAGRAAVLAGGAVWPARIGAGTYLVSQSHCLTLDFLLACFSGNGRRRFCHAFQRVRRNGNRFLESLLRSHLDRLQNPNGV